MTGAPGSFLMQLPVCMLLLSSLQYPPQGAEWDMSTQAVQYERCRGGYMTQVMQTINTTWPNPDHIFFNNGKG